MQPSDTHPYQLPMQIQRTSQTPVLQMTYESHTKITETHLSTIINNYQPIVSPWILL